MRAIVTDGVVWSVCLCACLSVCTLVMFVSPAKTPEPIEMPFGRQTHVGPRKHVGILDGVEIPREGAIFGRCLPTIEKHWQ